MTKSASPHKLTFEVDKTSKGYIIQGVEIPEIILEVSNKKDIVKYIASAIDCYFDSFPEQHDILFKEKSELIEYSYNLEEEEVPKLIEMPVTI